MEEIWRRRVTALGEVWQVWADLGRGLGEDGWTAPSRCPGWDVAALYVHLRMFPVAVLEPPPIPVAGTAAPTVTAVQILRTFNEPGGVAHEVSGAVAAHASAGAAALERDALVAPFAEVGPAAVAALRARAPGAPVPWPGAAALTTWAEAVRIVLMESVVHLLDVRDALGRTEVEIPGAALTETAVLLAELAEPVAFIEAATGRSAVSPLPVVR